MSHPKVIFLVSFLAMPASFSSVHGAIHEGANIIGLSTQPNSTGEFQINNDTEEDLRLYLMVYGYSHPQGIVAWDCALELPDGLRLESVVLAGGGVNRHRQLGNFKVSTDTPLMPVDGLIHLATLDLKVLDAGEMAIYIGPDPQWGHDGMMGFARETYETIRQPLHWPHRCPGCPVFEFTYSQPAQVSLWGMVKALYRK